MKSIVQQLRESKYLTQTELAEKSRLSLRTIQRIEAGNIPKGYTLKALATAFEIDAEKLISAPDALNLDCAKLINLSTLLGLIFPFGGIIFPLILTFKTLDSANKLMGKNIVSIQIILATFLSLSLIVSPFIQKAFSLRFPVFMVPLILFLILKLFLVIYSGISLNKTNSLHKNLKINYL